MSKKPNHNSNDQDRILARFLDRDSDNVHTPEPGDQSREKDELFHFLEAYKSNVELKKHAESANVPDLNVKPASAQNRQIADPHQRNRILRIYPAIIRIAAILLIALFIGLFFYLTSGPSAELLTESSDSKVEWTLVDGSRAVLRPYSQLFEVRGDPETEHYRIEGEVYFDIIPDEERALIVDAGQGRVQVTGTRFSVSTWGDATLLLLESGSVIFSHLDGSQKNVLSPGQQITEKQGRISAPEPARPEVRLGWLNNELILDRRALSDVIPEVEHHFRINISVAHGLQDERVSGTLVLDEPESVLDDLAVTMGASVQKRSPGNYHIMHME